MLYMKDMANELAGIFFVQREKETLASTIAFS